MRTRIGLNELSLNVLIVLMIAVIAAFFSGVTVGRQMVLAELERAVSVPGAVEPAAPYGVEPGDPGWYPEKPPGLDYGRGDDPVACTQEAKLCPDGSYVGRTGPSCEFAPCPKE